MDSTEAFLVQHQEAMNIGKYLKVVYLTLKIHEHSVLMIFHLVHQQYHQQYHRNHQHQFLQPFLLRYLLQWLLLHQQLDLPVNVPMMMDFVTSRSRDAIGLGPELTDVKSNG